MYDINTTENTPPRQQVFIASGPIVDNLKKPAIKNKVKCKASKIRTRSGCFTCRKRKKKCDEIGPVCSGCSRNFLKCVWPDQPTQNLPKHFEISSALVKHDTSIQSLPEKGRSIPPTTFEIHNEKVDSKFCTTKAEVLSEMQRNDESIIECVSSIPTKLCSVFELKSYKHKNPFPKTAVIPDSIDVILDSISANPSVSPSSSTKSFGGSVHTEELPTEDNLHSISQMFDSLYSDHTHSPEEIDAFYNDLLNYDSKVSLPNVSIRNPLLASFREIFYARGCSYLASNKTPGVSSGETAAKYSEAAKRHYNSAVSIIQSNLISYGVKPDTMATHWTVVAIKLVCAADKSLGLLSECCILNAISNLFRLSPEDASVTLNSVNNKSNLNLERVLMSQVLFTYPFMIYFAKDDDFIKLLSPKKFYETYNNDISQILLVGDDINGYWLDNILYTAIISIYQNLTKLLWLLRMKNTIIASSFEEHMKQIKNDMAVLWTTIQTAEIQAESKPNTLIDFAKLCHMSLEIMFLLLNNSTSINSSAPIVEFYIDQFISHYESYTHLSAESNQTFRIPDSFMLLPLFIVACSAQNLYHKEFISKELYIQGRKLGINFIESLASKIEDLWCVEQAKGVKSFSHLLSRHSFQELVN
ncbi:hypothetical protein CANINC_000764 [Pichia inconspicua]|uniref:Zn(2)-C6 fungal-type domain-containing protein n=1 Tax=Pichia inconspicua TaxID=52247 RepID=A0A4T0X597_9ASCO|nr:hypothetical protein CANINC_000764 [[Candida] inconspicua]